MTLRAWTLLALVLAPASLALSAFGQDAPAPSGALEQLESADGEGRLMDGSELRREGPLAIISERKNVVLEGPKHFPAERGCFDTDQYANVLGGSNGPHVCGTFLAHKETVLGDIQTVRIADRDEYKMRKGAKWGLIGGAIGALGFFALFAGPLGWAVGGIATAVGFLIGAGVAGAKAAKDPEVFTRVVNERRIVTDVERE